MPKVKLEPIYPRDFGGPICAPSFCPYKGQAKNEHNQVVDSVDPALCPLCRICTFVPATVSLDLELTQAEHDTMAKFLTSDDRATSSSLAGQLQYLQKEGRLPLAVLLSYQVFEAALKSAVPEKTRFDALKSHFLTIEDPICHIIGVPTYYSRKLTRSSVQVVGEIVWK